jgi:hypothetical protein
MTRVFGPGCYPSHAVFSAKFDEIQQQLQAISCMDDLLAGVVYTFEVSSGVNNVLTLMYIYTYICYRNAE